MVLLTGGAGYIGSHIAVELLNAGYEVVIVDNFSNSSPEAVKRIGLICGKDPILVTGDASDSAVLDSIFTSYPIDSVIHLAGFKSVPASVSVPLSYYRNNLDCTMAVMEAMARHGCKKIVFSSSATVYSTGGEPPFSEDAPTACLNPYGWTKWMSERIITDACTADPTISAVLLRYFNPVGAHKSGLIGEDPEGIPLNLFPYICQVAVGRLERLNVNGNDYPTPDGTGVRDYIHVTDLAKGHLSALDFCEGHPGCEIFNLGTGEGYSVLQMVKAFEDTNKVPVPYVIAPRRPGDIASCWADVSKAENVLGWKTEKTLEDICRDAWCWQSKNPMGYK